MKNFNCKIINSRELDDEIHLYCDESDHISPYYIVIMRYAYDEKELYKERFEALCLEYDYCGIQWEYDWYEGQEKIQLFAILEEQDIIDAFMHHIL